MSSTPTLDRIGIDPTTTDLILETIRDIMTVSPDGILALATIIDGVNDRAVIMKQAWANNIPEHKT